MLRMDERYRMLGPAKTDGVTMFRDVNTIGYFTIRPGTASLLVLIVASVACAVSACSVTSWKSTFGRNHPLTGRIWDVSSAGFIDRQNLFIRLARADFVLLGERHDNPDHHLLQAEVLRSLIALDASRSGF